MLDLRWEPRTTPWTLSVFLIFCLFACFKVTWLSCKKHNCCCIQRIHNSLPLSIFIPPSPASLYNWFLSHFDTPLPLLCSEEQFIPKQNSCTIFLLKVINCFGQPQAYTPQDTHTHAVEIPNASSNTSVCPCPRKNLYVSVRARTHTHTKTTCCTFCMQKFKCVHVCVWEGANSISFLPSCCLSLGGFFLLLLMQGCIWAFLMLYKSLKFVKVVCILILLVVCILNWNVRWEEDAGLCEDSWDIFLSLFWDDRITTPRIQVELVLPLHHHSCAIYKIVEITWCMLPKALSLTLINRHDVSSVHIWCKYPTYMRRTRRKQPTLSE